MSKFLVIIGLLALAHSGYSAAQYRSFLRLIGQEYNGLLPTDILLQVLLSLVITLFAIVRQAASFREIKALDDMKNKSLGTITNHPSFYTFNHRGRLFQ